MTVQARMSAGDPRLYNPNRDVAHCFGFVLDACFERAYKKQWPSLEKVLGAAYASPDFRADLEQCEAPDPSRDVGEALAALGRFVSEPGGDMHEVLERSGFFAVPAPAQVAALAHLGLVTAGVYFNGARDATLGGHGPLATNESLREAGLECARLMAMPRWRRRLAVLRRRAGRALAALRSDG